MKSIRYAVEAVGLKIHLHLKNYDYFYYFEKSIFRQKLLNLKFESENSFSHMLLIIIVNILRTAFRFYQIDFFGYKTVKLDLRLQIAHKVTIRI